MKNKLSFYRSLSKEDQKRFDKNETLFLERMKRKTTVEDIYISDDLERALKNNEELKLEIELLKERLKNSKKRERKLVSEIKGLNVEIWLLKGRVTRGYL